MSKAYVEVVPVFDYSRARDCATESLFIKGALTDFFQRNCQLLKSQEDLKVSRFAVMEDQKNEESENIHYLVWVRSPLCRFKVVAGQYDHYLAGTEAHRDTTIFNDRIKDGVIYGVLPRSGLSIILNGVKISNQIDYESDTRDIKPGWCLIRAARETRVHIEIIGDHMNEFFETEAMLSGLQVYACLDELRKKLEEHITGPITPDYEQHCRARRGNSIASVLGNYQGLFKDAEGKPISQTFGELEKDKPHIYYVLLGVIAEAMYGSLSTNS